MKWHHETRRGRSGNNADGVPRAERVARRPIAAWPLIATTWQGLCAVAFAVALWYVALLMDEQTLVAAALAVSVAIIVDIVMIVAQWRGCRIWAEQVISSRGLHRFDWRGAWWPRRARSALLYRAYDVDDRGRSDRFCAPSQTSVAIIDANMPLSDGVARWDYARHGGRWRATS